MSVFKCVCVYAHGSDVGMKDRREKRESKSEKVKQRKTCYYHTFLSNCYSYKCEIYPFMNIYLAVFVYVENWGNLLNLLQVRFIH